jgi:hexosaminidase
VTATAVAGALAVPVFAAHPSALTAAAIPVMGGIVPGPVSLSPSPSSPYLLGTSAQVEVSAGSIQASGVANYLAATLRRSTGFRLPVVTFSGDQAPSGGITLQIGGAPARVGQEGYVLSVGKDGVVIRANAGEGLFDGVQTLRQILPAAAEASTRQRGPWVVPGGRILDYPRYTYRGALLDVARHFFPVATVEAYIDQISLYKVNYLTLHLSDDQGWRIQIPGYPRLTSVGGSTSVGGGRGGYFTDAQYKAIVAYAQARYITVIPEVDMPGHTGAAVSSYGDLACNNVAPPVYTGINVGISSVCIGKRQVNAWAKAVIDEVASLTPGPYLSLGGDETVGTTSGYRAYVDMVQKLIASTGKSAMGWEPSLTQSDLALSTVAVYWETAPGDPSLASAAAHGTKVVMAPAEYAYLDQKYSPATKLGLDWAGPVSVQQSYSFDPATLVNGVPAKAVIGVEAALWSETLTNLADIDYMAFPRLPAIAEIGWSPEPSLSWPDFRQRLAHQGPLWKAMGINYYASPEVPWP